MQTARLGRAPAGCGIYVYGVVEMCVAPRRDSEANGETYYARIRPPGAVDIIRSPAARVVAWLREGLAYVLTDVHTQVDPVDDWVVLAPPSADEWLDRRDPGDAVLAATLDRAARLADTARRPVLPIASRLAVPIVSGPLPDLDDDDFNRLVDEVCSRCPGACLDDGPEVYRRAQALKACETRRGPDVGRRHF